MILPDSPSDDLGYAIAALGNIDGSADDSIEVLVGAPLAGTVNISEGYARVYSTPFVPGASGSPTCDGSVPGDCPCPGAVSAANAGCPNSGSANGAMLVGSGTPSVSTDTFSLSVSGAGANKPGLVISGTIETFNNQVADSAGILCAGGVTARGDIFFTDILGGTLLPHFQLGSAYSASATVSAGAQQIYQYWFRDPFTAAGCPGDTAASDFNFSNGWVVTWTP